MFVELSTYGAVRFKIFDFNEAPQLSCVSHMLFYVEDDDG